MTALPPAGRVTHARFVFETHRRMALQAWRELAALSPSEGIEQAEATIHALQQLIVGVVDP